MSVLNMPSDGLFNVLIVLTRAIVRFGAKSRDEVLKACGANLELVDPKQLNQTLNRWTEVGLFSSEDGLVAIREPYRGRLGGSVDNTETRLPKIVREIALAPQNNERFWESEENKSADLSRGLSWILAQDVYRTDTGSHGKIGALEGAQVTDVTKRIFQNDTRWNGLRTWMIYLGFARGGPQVTIDPSEALRDVLPDIFESAETLPAPIFIEQAAKRLPVLDGGAYRVQLEAVLNPQSWAPPPDGHVSTSLSRAIQRLDREGMIATGLRSDSEGGITLIGAERRTWRTVTHVRRLPARNVKRHAIGTPDRHPIGTPLRRWERLVPVANRRDPRASRRALTSDGAARVGGACLPTGASRGGTTVQARFLKRQLALPVSMISQ